LVVLDLFREASSTALNQKPTAVIGLNLKTMQMDHRASAVVDESDVMWLFLIMVGA
jgi:hypothetical protein